MDEDQRSTDGAGILRSSERKPRRNPAVVWNEQDFPASSTRSIRVRRLSSFGISLPDTGIGVLLHNQRYYTLNQVGSVIWALLDGTRTEEQLVGEVIRCYELEQEVALLATRDLLDALRTEGLLENNRSPTDAE